MRQIVPSNPTSREKRQSEVGSGVQESQSAPFDEFLSLAAHTHMPHLFFPFLLFLLSSSAHGQTFVSSTEYVLRPDLHAACV